MEKICTASLLPEDIHPCDNNPLLTTPGGGSEWSHQFPLPPCNSAEEIKLLLKFYFNKTFWDVFLEAKTLSDLHNLLCKNPKFPPSEIPYIQNLWSLDYWKILRR